ncbi:hypothetical protein BDK51DRAFT_33836 [Blyttiomyces helicus]|uniref:Uncharacterized protein n=1 Tax=Blyttiomyces helicus TaxID=388810 RepID=A0A4P9W014_9FUNG|nr:hypothetical protein BDK51DRAFT_33836 [Blyttiomyces helicus]|eukprot:RKO84008.1 hypothetical protein BDK51DRAFT_33836 [Blyttiomyces helicus]
MTTKRDHDPHKPGQRALSQGTLVKNDFTRMGWESKTLANGSIRFLIPCTLDGTANSRVLRNPNTASGTSTDKKVWKASATDCKTIPERPGFIHQQSNALNDGCHHDIWHQGCHIVKLRLMLAPDPKRKLEDYLGLSPDGAAEELEQRLFELRGLGHARHRLRTNETNESGRPQTEKPLRLSALQTTTGTMSNRESARRVASCLIKLGLGGGAGRKPCGGMANFKREGESAALQGEKGALGGSVHRSSVLYGHWKERSGLGGEGGSTGASRTMTTRIAKGSWIVTQQAYSTHHGIFTIALRATQPGEAGRVQRKATGRTGIAPSRRKTRPFGAPFLPTDGLTSRETGMRQLTFL